MADGSYHAILEATNGSSTAFVINFKYNTSLGYQVKVKTRNDDGTWADMAYLPISDDVHFVEVDWQAATAAGANNGTASMWVDGAFIEQLTGLDNDTYRIETVKLGAASGLDAGTLGTMYFDAFESRRTSYIGPAYGAALPLYTGRGSVTAYIGGSASLPYSYGISTPYPTPTSQPGLTTSTYSYAAQSGTCPDGALPAKPHAVTSVGSDTYCYDKNGNMVKRVEGGVTYTQVFDIENRLSSVTVGGVTTSFVYDGDGNLVKKVKGTTTTHYVGAYEVELNSGTVTKKTTYYGPAMRVDIVGGSNTVYYMLADHLGSASVLLKSDGTIETNGEQRYYPFGESRITTADLKTAHLFTGQLDMGLGGIYHFGARFYLPRLGRFLSADTVVPNRANPQTLNRYAYGYNNPPRYIDPTGHAGCYDSGLEIGQDISEADCWAWGRDKWLLGIDLVGTPKAGKGYRSDAWISSIQPSAFDNISFDGEWDPSDKAAAILGAYRVGVALAAVSGGNTASEIFAQVFGKITFTFSETKADGYYCQRTTGGLTCYSNAQGKISPHLVAHELAHVFNAVIVNNNPGSTIAPYSVIANTGISVEVNGENVLIAGNNKDGKYQRTDLGYRSDSVYQQDKQEEPGEDFADTFMNWAFNSFDNDAYGAARYDWMTTNMAEWIPAATK